MNDPVTQLIAGERPPRHKDDFDILFYIGGVRKRPWPQKWIECQICSGEFPATGYPAPAGKWYWPTICNACADLLEGKMPQAPPVPQSTPRSPHND